MIEEDERIKYSNTWTDLDTRLYESPANEAWEHFHTFSDSSSQDMLKAGESINYPEDLS